MLNIGKLPDSILKSIILDKLNFKRDEVILRPGIGEDCCALDLNDSLCILTTDPITGTDKQIGIISVHICCNDIAACGAEPIGILVTLLAPPDFTESGLNEVMSQISKTAESLNVDIIGGHTEVTDAVNRLVISGTAIGKVCRERLVSSSGAKPGNVLLMTKTAGVEGTAILANDHSAELIPLFGEKLVTDAKGYINRISVVKEGIIASRFKIDAMHDATEGGVLGAAWEIAEASGLGMEIFADSIPVSAETAAICDYFKISPLKLVSSGCMLIACGDAAANDLIALLRTNGIDAGIIGRFDNSGRRVLIKGDVFETILSPGPDELYKVALLDISGNCGDVIRD